MNEAFPDAAVQKYEKLVDSLTLPDPDDRHVLAAAIHAQAQYIITANLKDFPVDQLSVHTIEAQHPDVFIAHLLAHYPDAVVQAFLVQVANLRNPQKTVYEVLNSLRKAGLTTTADKLIKLL